MTGQVFSIDSTYFKVFFSLTSSFDALDLCQSVENLLLQSCRSFHRVKLTIWLLVISDFLSLASLQVNCFNP